MQATNKLCLHGQCVQSTTMTKQKQRRRAQTKTSKVKKSNTNHVLFLTADGLEITCNIKKRGEEKSLN